MGRIKLERDGSVLGRADLVAFVPGSIGGEKFNCNESVFVDILVMCYIDQPFRECIPYYNHAVSVPLQWHDWDWILPGLAGLAAETAEINTEDEFFAKLDVIDGPDWESVKADFCLLLAEFADWVEARRDETDVIWHRSI